MVDPGASGPSSLWGVLNSWLNAAGVTTTGRAQAAPDRASAQEAARRVPPEVCANCPICQAAATLDQVGPEVLADIAHTVRDLAGGIAAAMDAAAEQRRSTGQDRQQAESGTNPGPSTPPGPSSGADAGAIVEGGPTPPEAAGRIPGDEGEAAAAG